MSSQKLIKAAGVLFDKDAAIVPSGGNPRGPGFGTATGGLGKPGGGLGKPGGGLGKPGGGGPGSIRSLSMGPMPQRQPIAPRPPRRMPSAPVPLASSQPQPPLPSPVENKPPGFEPATMPTPYQRPKPMELPQMPKMPQLSESPDPQLPQSLSQPQQPAQPPPPTQPPTGPSLDANTQDRAGQIDAAAGIMPPEGQGGKAGPPPEPGQPPTAGYDFGGTVQDALGGARDLMGRAGNRISDSLSGMGQKAQSAMHSITGAGRQAAGDLMQGARGLFGGQQPEQPVNPRGPEFEQAVADMPQPSAEPEAGPRGPEFDAAVADFDQRMAPPEGMPSGMGQEQVLAGMGIDPSQGGGGGIPALMPGDQERIDRENALGTGMAMGGGPQEPEPGPQSRFHKQLEHFGALSREEPAGEGGELSPKQRQAGTMLDYYKGLETGGDAAAKRLQARTAIGDTIEPHEQNYLDRREEFESGRDPNAFNPERSQETEQLLAGDAARRRGMAPV